MGQIDAATFYQIRVSGQLDDRWSDWFGGLAISVTPNETLLSGPVADQAALRGVLEKIWDLNLVVLAVTRLDEFGYGGDGRTDRQRKEIHLDE
jgi:hypothetical protein